LNKKYEIILNSELGMTICLKSVQVKFPFLISNIFYNKIVCHAREVGANNIFGIQCMVGPGVRV